MGSLTGRWLCRGCDEARKLQHLCEAGGALQGRQNTRKVGPQYVIYCLAHGHVCMAGARPHETETEIETETETDHNK